MPLPAAIRIADRDRRFADLGETILLRTPGRAYDPLTQRTIETADDVELLAIVGPEPHSPTPGTAGEHATGRLTVLVKDEDLATLPAPGQRIVRAGEEYDILSAARSADGLTWEIECRRR